jgi:hypothetical protein
LGSHFHVFAPGLIFDDTDGVEFIFRVTYGVKSRFHVFRSRTLFRRCGGRRDTFSCFALSDYFSTVPRASGLVFMFSLWTHFRLCGERRVQFSCFALPDSFSAVPRAWGLVFMFRATGHVFDGAEGVRSRFHVLRSRTHFLRFRGLRVPFSCFARSNSFSAVPTASGPVFMFCTPELIFNCSKGVRSYFHVLRPRTSFRRNRGRRVHELIFPF